MCLVVGEGHSLVEQGKMDTVSAVGGGDQGVYGGVKESSTTTTAASVGTLICCSGMGRKDWAVWKSLTNV